MNVDGGDPSRKRTGACFQSFRATNVSKTTGRFHLKQVTNPWPLPGRRKDHRRQSSPRETSRSASPRTTANGHAAGCAKSSRPRDLARSGGQHGRIANGPREELLEWANCALLEDVGNLPVIRNSLNCKIRAAQYAPDQAETDPSGAFNGAMDGNVTQRRHGVWSKAGSPGHRFDHHGALRLRAFRSNGRTTNNPIADPGPTVSFVQSHFARLSLNSRSRLIASPAKAGAVVGTSARPRSKIGAAARIEVRMQVIIGRSPSQARVFGSRKKLTAMSSAEIRPGPHAMMPSAIAAQVI
jgi:hypothetical protein